MKALRYLLIAFAVMTVLSVSAQSLAQQPSVEFQSTSSMVGSGSTLPQAAQSGAYTTYETGPAKIGSVIKRDETGFGGDDDDDPDKPGGDHSEMWENPIGDGLLPLMLLACAYGAFVLYRKRQQRNDRMME